MTQQRKIATAIVVLLIAVGIWYFFIRKGDKGKRGGDPGKLADLKKKLADCNEENKNKRFGAGGNPCDAIVAEIAEESSWGRTRGRGSSSHKENEGDGEGATGGGSVPKKQCYCDGVFVGHFQNCSQACGLERKR